MPTGAAGFWQARTARDSSAAGHQVHRVAEASGCYFELACGRATAYISFAICSVRPP